MIKAVDFDREFDPWKWETEENSTSNTDNDISKTIKNLSRPTYSKIINGQYFTKAWLCEKTFEESQTFHTNSSMHSRERIWLV